MKVRPSFGVRCAYCHAADVWASLIACRACGTLLHAECWASVVGCPTLGCGTRCRPRIKVTVPRRFFDWRRRHRVVTVAAATGFVAALMVPVLLAAYAESARRHAHKDMIISGGSGGGPRWSEVQDARSDLIKELNEAHTEGRRALRAYEASLVTGDPLAVVYAWLEATRRLSATYRRAGELAQEWKDPYLPQRLSDLYSAVSRDLNRLRNAVPASLDRRNSPRRVRRIG